MDEAILMHVLQAFEQLSCKVDHYVHRHSIRILLFYESSQITAFHVLEDKIDLAGLLLVVEEVEKGHNVWVAS